MHMPAYFIVDYLKNIKGFLPFFMNACTVFFSPCMYLTASSLCQSNSGEKKSQGVQKPPKKFNSENIREIEKLKINKK